MTPKDALATAVEVAFATTVTLVPHPVRSHEKVPTWQFAPFADAILAALAATGHTVAPATPPPSAEALAKALTRIRGAHGPVGECTPDTPCQWCSLAAVQAHEAIAALTPAPSGGAAIGERE